MMASINDWAAKAAERIDDEYGGRGTSRTVERIAAIIATYAEPLMKLLQEARREHFQSCEALLNYDDDGDKVFDNECTCGADAWNERVDKALNGEP
jgi:hypothetical protein